ncbi:MAG: hypothetical protein A2918_01290 [Candidatus Yanofskybacteria bacterium RIFCSPLOWO2_01_FULL_42_49]|uniref:Uncharacterized protein n=1 Tax=Candidatus Yanofskybacteria bacterium RIFCSPLOWO2_01_FULL_42_49 TaxID=1802694 RepID=A0A1F8GBH6_9BACT|nr:MAG: hypothetical protein A2918_01290 [Candidatus Yanofskybacteria bacterium RIFCSPLOWO2_01_FULL_42_49]
MKLSDSELRFRFFRFLATAATGGEMGSNCFKNTEPSRDRLSRTTRMAKLSQKQNHRNRWFCYEGINRISI